MPLIHPFDPITPAEIQTAAQLIRSSQPHVSIRFRRIDIKDPVKRQAIPYIEATRLGESLPAPPPRLVEVLFDNNDNSVFCKALLNVTAQSVIYIKELPKHVQVS